MTKALIILIAVIAATEAIVMAMLAAIGTAQLGPWIPALFDAIMVSFVSIVTVNRMLKYSLISLRGGGRGEFMQLKVGAIVFTIETIVMLVLHLSPLDMTGWQEGLFDTITLALGSSLLIYGFVLKPSTEIELNNRGEGIRFKQVIVINMLGYACLMILFLMVLIVTYEQQLQQRSMEIKQHESKKLELAKESFLNQLQHAAHDLLILANQNDLREIVSGDRHSFSELLQEYKNIVAIKSYYAQLRLFDVDGKELIRVQCDGKLIKLIPQHQLQNKRDRYYYQEMIRLSQGEIYISPLDLNVEYGIVEQPFNPVIRLATPVVNRHGKKAGVIVINLRGNYLLQKLEDATKTTIGRIMLLNAEGYWLFGGEPGDHWSFMFQDKREQSFQTRYTEAWKKIKRQVHGMVLTDNGTFVVETIEFSPERTLDVHTIQHAHKGHDRHWPVWKLVSHIPPDRISGQMQDIRILMILLFITVLVLAAFGTAMLTKAMLKHRQAEMEIRQLAFYDPLTGLTNRRLFNEKMELEMGHALRYGTTLALMYLDLDHFKPINDEFGHDAGDMALRDAAKRLKACLRDCDTLCRLGGDEFALLLPKVGNHDDIVRIAQRIINTFSEEFHLLSHTRHLGVSIGIEIMSVADETPQDLIRRADQAMYEAKNAGGNCFRIAQH